jgi:hypothetical protein
MYFSAPVANLPPREAARLTANLDIEVLVGSDGSAQKISFDSAAASATARKVFDPVTEKAIRASKFDGSCSEIKVNLIFHFVLAKEPSMSFGYPNQFWISVQPKHWEA